MNETGQPRKVSRAIDIFSLGCVFYYVLSGGAHPFGDRYMREANIIRNRASLDHLDLLGDIGFLARDLIARMILPKPKERPDASTVLQHPFFWSAERRLNFLLDVSDRFELEERDPPSPLLLLLEEPAQQVVGDNWASKLDRHFLENLGKYRKYKGHSIMDLLRAMRNKKHHYQDLPEQVQHALGPLPHGFLSYFMSRFPLLLLHAYYLVKEHLQQEALFVSYFQ
jgi:serine/threonine-protein kinase/endoribonuclease IRE1